MAYAALQSLKQTINSRLNRSNSRILHPSSGILFPSSEWESIYEDLCSLQSIIETLSSVQNSERVDALQRKIRDLAHTLEDLIESHSPDRSTDENSTLLFSEELMEAKHELCSFTEMLKAEDWGNREDQQSSNSFAADDFSSRTGSGKRNIIVGLEDELKQLKNWIFQDSKKLEVISIFGMVGIGKTTLAEEVYFHKVVTCSFRHRFFFTIGPKYQLKDFLQGVVGCMGISIDDIHKKKDKEIGVYLYQFLVGRRYLIVLDDLWNTHIWNELKQFIPDDKRSGSRVILTTRNQDVANLASTSRHSLKVPFLDEHPSWSLLHQMVFASGELCPPQLEDVGKKIAKKCDGLPLAIASAANFLVDSEKTVENWNRIAENEISGIIYTAISEALKESYKLLPPHLKACFLYMGVFPRNYEIPTSKLLKLWVVEGFFEPKMGKTLEQMAQECLDNLISRSLVLVDERSSRGRPKTCRIHFLIRDLCVNEAEKEKFFCVLESNGARIVEGTKSQRRLCIHNNILFSLKEVHSSMQSISAARSLLCVGPQHQHPLRVFLSFTWLKVLDAHTVYFYRFPHEVLNLVQLKYLAITYDGELPASISRLGSLEVLIVHRYQSIKSSDAPVYLPIEIWKLQRLKHLECLGFDLPDPSDAARGSTGDGCDDSLILEKLLTLSGVSIHSCTHGVFARMPNLLKLRIWIESTRDTVETFRFFGDYADLCHYLESFKCIVMNRGLACQVVSPIPAFPINLRKITLSRCGFSWNYMRNIGKLPNLEVLKLRCYAFRGTEWETDEEQFPQLKFLLLEDLDIEHWRTNEEHFPLLQHLIIRHCYKLEEIPNDIIEFPTIELIEVDDCSQSSMNSARELQVEQKESGNPYPLFRIHSLWQHDMHFT